MPLSCSGVCWKSGSGEEVRMARTADNAGTAGKSKPKTFRFPALKLEGLSRGEEVSAQDQQHVAGPQNSFR